MRKLKPEMIEEATKTPAPSRKTRGGSRQSPQDQLRATGPVLDRESRQHDPLHQQVWVVATVEHQRPIEHGRTVETDAAIAACYDATVNSDRSRGRELPTSRPCPAGRRPAPRLHPRGRPRSRSPATGSRPTSLRPAPRRRRPRDRRFRALEGLRQGTAGMARVSSRSKTTAMRFISIRVQRKRADQFDLREGLEPAATTSASSRSRGT